MEQTTASFEINNKKTKLIYIGLCSLLVLIGLSICLFVLLYVAQQRLAALGEIRDQSDMLANRLHQSSDDLTRLVRTYAVTGNKKFEQQFWDVLAIRDGVKPRPLHYERIYWDFLSVENGKPPYPLGKAVSLVKLMKAAGFTERELSMLAEAQRNSDQLVKLEQVAMNAINGITTGESEEIPNDTSGQQVAIRILFGERYHQAKIEIMRHINMFLEELDNRTSTEFVHQASRLQILLFSQISTFTLIICVVAFLMRISKQYHAGMVSTLNSTVKARTQELEREISERKRVEMSLRTSEGKFRSISATAQDSIIMMDDEGKIALWNPAAKKLFGYTKEEAVGKDLHSLIVPHEFRETFWKGFSRFIDTGQGPVIGKTLVLASLKKDGTKFYADHSFSSLKIKDKWHAISIIRDITERKEMEEKMAKRTTELSEANTSLEEKNKELENFNELFIGREFRINELRERVKELEGREVREEGRGG